MNLLHKTVFTEAFILTRWYVQDVAKTVGKVQQLFMPATAGNSLYGLEVWPEGISTQSFAINGKPQRVLINLQKGLVQWGDKIWPLNEYRGHALQAELQKHLKSLGSNAVLAMPDYVLQESAYSGEHAAHLADLLWWGHGAMAATQNKIDGAQDIPLLLFPHHFDEAVQWQASEAQTFTFGFSPGDETITDPYFYVTADPETAKFAMRPVPSPAYWQSEGFTGAVMRLQDFWLADDVAGRAEAFITHMLGDDSAS